ncbi:MAG: hypothetical protein R3E91_00230 [Chlamydiales bacterium]
MIRRLSFFFIIVSLLFGVGFWYLSDGFSVNKIRIPFSFNPDWEVETTLSPVEIRRLLSQTFNYLGKGSHAFIFVSEDQQYILKFFRFSRYSLEPIQKIFPLPKDLAAIQSQNIKEKALSQNNFCMSCKLAYEYLKEECQIIYLHLNKTTYLKQNLTLYDNLKRSISIPIDHYAFVVQRRGKQIYPYLDELLKERKTQQIQNAFISLSSLLNKQIAKGLVNNCTDIDKNIGFFKGKAMFFDVGQFNQMTEDYDVKKSIDKLLIWLNKRDSKLASDARMILNL